MADKKQKKITDKETRRKKAMLICSIILLVLMAFFFVLFFFRVKKVEVTGNCHNTDYAVREQIIRGPLSANTLFLSIFRGHPKMSGMPFVDRVSVDYIDRNTIRIRVNEIEVTGCTVFEDKYYYFNESGVVQLVSDTLLYSGDLTEEESTQITASSDSEPRDVYYIPLVEGLNLSDAADQEALAVENPSVFRTITSITGMINKDKVSPDLLTIKEDGIWTMKCGNILILLGKDDHMEEKIEELSGILPEAQDLSGTLHLEDFDGSQNRIIFDKGIG